MKELSIEEKAKRYDEAIKRAKSKIKNDKDHVLYEDDVIEIFPELKESEDERIRKQIISFLKEFEHDHYRCLDFSSWIAWLEKQGEQIDIANKEYWRGYREGKKEILNKYTELEKQGEQKHSWSEEDEHRVKDAIYFLATSKKHYASTVEIDACIDWLKSIRQSFNEEKVNNANKVESKFKVGDWAVENEPNNYARFIQILEIVNVQGEDKYRISRDIYNDEDIVDFDFVEKYYHKFDIKDAKDGDVRESAVNQSFIYNGKYTDSVVGAHIGISLDGEELFATKTNNWTMNKGVKPATKEQRDTLFAKMKEKSFKWDAEKKELNKTIEIPFGTKDSELQEATYYIPDGYHAEINGNEVVIKKGKQNTIWKPTEEQIKALEHYVATIQESVYSYFHKDNAKLLHSLLEQLKTL